MTASLRLPRLHLLIQLGAHIYPVKKHNRAQDKRQLYLTTNTGQSALLTIASATFSCKKCDSPVLP